MSRNILLRLLFLSFFVFGFLNFILSLFSEHFGRDASTSRSVETKREKEPVFSSAVFVLLFSFVIFL